MREQLLERTGLSEPGVVKTLWVGVVVLLLASVAYLVPGLERFRAWTPGDPVPFSGLFGGRRGQDPVAQGSGAVGDMDDQALLAALPAGEGGPTGGKGRVPATVPPGEPREISDRPGPGQLGEAVGAGSTPEPSSSAGPPRVPATEMEGLPRAIETPTPDALGSFYSKLARVASKEPGAMARILFYGASTIGTDGITSALRHRLQRMFGDGGKGFVVVAPAWPTQAHKDVKWRVSGDRWSTYPVTHRSRSDGHYGLGGILAINRGHSIATFETVTEGPSGAGMSRFELWYRGWPRGGKVELTLDRGSPVVLSTRSDEDRDLIHTVEMEDGHHRMRVRAVGGRLQLYGVVMERPGPGVVVDSVMLIGSRANRLLNFDPDHWARQISMRRSDLLVLLMGDNEIESEPPPRLDRFEAQFKEVLGRLRAGRAEAACLVLSPTDHGVRRRGRIVTHPLVTKIVDIERRAALEAGCGFLDMFQAMGGEGAMGRWFKARPRLGWGDFVHFTARGSELLGMLIYKAMVSDYDKWLGRHYGEAGEEG